MWFFMALINKKHIKNNVLCGIKLHLSFIYEEFEAGFCCYNSSLYTQKWHLDNGYRWNKDR
jgi:hypothetical protein